MSSPRAWPSPFLPSQRPLGGSPQHDGARRSSGAAAATASPGTGLQRARGLLRLSWHCRDRATALHELRQEGCLKARLPRVENAGWANAVLLNSSGGVVAGDVLTTEIEAGAGTRVVAATQAAERIYRAGPEARPAQIRASLAAGAGAALEWLPQETILFDGAALDRILDIDLAPDAWFLGAESLVFGRSAMGEEVRRLALADTWRVRRAGRLVLHDAIRLHGPAAAALDRAAVGNGARAVATILHAAPLLGQPGMDRQLDALCHALQPFDAGATCVGGLLLARIVAPHGAALRCAVAAGLAALRDGRSLPRVWAC